MVCDLGIFLFVFLALKRREEGQVVSHLNKYNEVNLNVLSNYKWNVFSPVVSNFTLDKNQLSNLLKLQLSLGEDQEFAFYQEAPVILTLTVYWSQ